MMTNNHMTIISAYYIVYVPKTLTGNFLLGSCTYCDCRLHPDLASDKSMTSHIGPLLLKYIKESLEA